MSFFRGLWIPTSERHMEDAERTLLQEAVQWSGSDSVRYEQQMVPVDGNGNALNTVTFFNTQHPNAVPEVHQAVSSAEGAAAAAPGGETYRAPPIRNDEPHVVFCHGFGAGLALYARSMAKLAAREPGRTYSAIDWIGFGRSTRPEFAFHRAELQEVEGTFADSLERWRAARGIPKMVLCGHSLGGYFAAAYAERYPDRVERLVLASAIGLPDEPEEMADPFHRAGVGIKTLVWTFRTMWNNHLTPFALLRGIGPAGPALLDNFFQRRFRGREPLPGMQQYVYHINAAPPSGESALTAVLKPSVFAKQPIGPRVARLPMKTDLLHGTYDWVSPSTGRQLQELKPEQFRLVLVPESGHQMFVENPEGFADAMHDILRQVPKKIDPPADMGVGQPLVVPPPPTNGDGAVVFTRRDSEGFRR